jgi:hypothetical protein
MILLHNFKQTSYFNLPKLIENASQRLFPTGSWKEKSPFVMGKMSQKLILEFWKNPMTKFSRLHHEQKWYSNRRLIF